MKTVLKIFCAVLCLSLFSTMPADAGLYSEFGAQKAYSIAKEPTSDPIIGIWKGYAVSGDGKRLPPEKERTVFCAIIPADNSDWDYMVILLEDFPPLYSRGKGRIKAYLRKTEQPNLYWSSSWEAEVYPHAMSSPVIYTAPLLDFSSLQTSLPNFPIAIMAKGEYSISEFEPKQPKLSDGDTLRNILAPANPGIN